MAGERNVYLLVPNLIGYVRIIFAFVAFYFAYKDYRFFFAFYSVSQLLDAFDGLAARMLNQGSRFGAVLDMVTDRFSTNILNAILAHLYPEWSLAFFLLMVLDFVSHWAHMYSSMLLGSESHKDMNTENFFIRLYYTSKPVLFIVCACQEAFFVGLYLMYWASRSGETTIYQFGYWVCILAAPLNLFKQGMNFLQLKLACDSINRWEATEGKKS